MLCFAPNGTRVDTYFTVLLGSEQAVDADPRRRPLPAGAPFCWRRRQYQRVTPCSATFGVFNGRALEFFPITQGNIERGVVEVTAAGEQVASWQHKHRLSRRQAGGVGFLGCAGSLSASAGG